MKVTNFRKGECFSQIGMVGNEQEISLGENLGGYYGDFEYKIRVLGYG